MSAISPSSEQGAASLFARPLPPTHIQKVGTKLEFEVVAVEGEGKEV